MPFGVLELPPDEGAALNPKGLRSVKMMATTSRGARAEGGA